MLGRKVGAHDSKSDLPVVNIWLKNKHHFWTNTYMIYASFQIKKASNGRVSIMVFPVFDNKYFANDRCGYHCNQNCIE